MIGIHLSYMHKADFEKEMKAIFGVDADASAIKKKLEEELGDHLTQEEVVRFYSHRDEAAKSLEGALYSLSALEKGESDNEIEPIHPSIDGVRIASGRRALRRPGNRNLEDNALRNVMQRER